MLPARDKYEATEVQVQSTHLRGLTTPDPGNQGIENELGWGGHDQLCCRGSHTFLLGLNLEIGCDKITQETHFNISFRIL